MECPVCVSETEIMSISSSCLHGACSKCVTRLRDKPCYYCRDLPGAGRITMKATDYDLFLNKDEDKLLLPSVDPFDVLFGDKYADTYKTFRNIIASKWKAAANQKYNLVCGPCMLAKKYPQVDTTLLTLFYACSPITRRTILDVMVCLCLLYGLRRCNNMLTPIGVYFHFFLNHCTTARGVSEEDQSEVCDFVSNIMHALVYDVPEVDALANFISTNLTSESAAKCACNESQRALDALSGRKEMTDKDSSDFAPFVPSGGNADKRQLAAAAAAPPPAMWANSFKWTQQHTECHQSRNDNDDDASAVNFFTIFTDCEVCDEMMDHANHARLNDMDRDIQLKRRYMNIATAVNVVCCSQSKGYADSLIKHYTQKACELNRLKFINFYSLVKQPHSFTGKTGGVASHLMSELFSSKMSHLCPTYHLACFSHQVIEFDTSASKKTKKEGIQKWAMKVIRRHRQPTIPPMLRSSGSN